MSLKDSFSAMQQKRIWHKLSYDMKIYENAGKWAAGFQSLALVS